MPNLGTQAELTAACTALGLSLSSAVSHDPTYTLAEVRRRRHQCPAPVLPTRCRHRRCHRATWCGLPCAARHVVLIGVLPAAVPCRNLGHCVGPRERGRRHVGWVADDDVRLPLRHRVRPQLALAAKRPAVPVQQVAGAGKPKQQRQRKSKSPRRFFLFLFFNPAPADLGTAALTSSNVLGPPPPVHSDGAPFGSLARAPPRGRPRSLPVVDPLGARPRGAARKAAHVHRVVRGAVTK